MELKFQYNKISMQDLQKKLGVRRAALPILKSRESVLRVTERRLKDALADLERRYRAKREILMPDIALWAEFPRGLYSMKSVSLTVTKVTGISVPQVKGIDYSILDFSRFLEPAWLSSGVAVLRDMTVMLAQIEVTSKAVETVEHARKKATQKVNLYEKVQIPAYEDALRRIKRFLEDEANLDTAIQKMTKQRAAQRTSSW